MNFDIIIPSRWSIWKLKNIIESISIQNQLPEKVHIIIDKFIWKDEYNVMMYFLLKNIDEEKKQLFNIVSNINSQLNPWQWVSYIRNFWIQISKSDYIYIIDDDNIFENDFLKNTINSYKKFEEKFWEEIFLSPSIIYRKTDKIQSLGFKKISSLTGKLKSCKWRWAYNIAKIIWGNSIFWKKSDFKQIKFDEYFEFVYEDIDFSWRASNKWYKIIVDRNLKINHMEWNKTKTEVSFIWNPKTAYQKARNRIILFKNNWNFFQKVIFLTIWVSIQTVWFFLLILIYWKEEKIRTIKAILAWTYDWLRY